jgi:uncharacterized protein YjbJ (UPF0337 family)
MGPGLRVLDVQEVVVRHTFDRKQRKHMKPSTKDQVQGKLHELKGKTKETAGQLTNNSSLTAEGRNEKLAGKIQKKVGQVEEVLEN